MHTRTATRPSLKLMLGMFLAIAIASPVVIDSYGAPEAPAWLGGAMALAALFGAFAVLARMGWVRVRYVVLFAAFVAIAAIAGPFIS